MVISSVYEEEEEGGWKHAKVSSPRLSGNRGL